MCSGAVHLSQQWSLHSPHQSNLLQQLFCPFLGTAKTYLYLSSLKRLGAGSWGKQGGYQNVTEDTNAVQRMEVIISNYLEMLSKTNQVKVKTETDLKSCSLIDSHGRRLLLCFLGYWSPGSAKFLQCLSVCVNAMYVMFLHSWGKNTTALISC